MIYLTPGRRLCFANLFFPTASIDSQLVEQPPLHSHSTASSPAFSSSPGVQTRMLWRLSAFRALQAQTFAKKNVRQKTNPSICLSVQLAGWLAGYLSIQLSLSSLPPENMNVSQTDVHLGAWDRKRGIAWVLLRHRQGIAKIHLIILQIWSADTVVLCQKAASRNNSSAELESAERQAKQCKFTWVSMETPFSNDTNLSQGSFDSLNNSSGEIIQRRGNRNGESSSGQ